MHYAPKRRMPHLVREVSRHGRVMWFVRKGAGPRTRIYGEPGTDEFRAAYEAALTGALNPKPREALVYFAKCGDRVKIGHSLEPRKRVASFSTGSAHRVRIYYVTPGGRKLEGELHKLFAHRRVNGEWFLWCREIIAWIEADEAQRKAAVREMADAD